MSTGVEVVSGNTDVAIQAAINKVVADTGGQGGLVLLPTITYLINNTITVPSKVTLQATGKQSAILLRQRDIPVMNVFGAAGGANGPGGVGGHIASPCFYDLCFQGNNAAWVSPLVQMAYVHTAKFDSCSFQFAGGMAFYIICEVWDSTWLECRWDNSGGTNTGLPAMQVQSADGTAFPGFGSSTDSTNDLRFFHCTWEGFHDGAFWCPGGIAGANPAGNFYFFGCKADQNATALGDWFRFEACGGIYISDLDLASTGAGPAYTGTPFAMFTFKAVKNVVLRNWTQYQNSAATDCLIHFDGVGFSGNGNRWITLDGIEVTQIGSGATSYATGMIRYTGTNLNQRFQFISYPRYTSVSPLAIKPIFNLTAGTATYGKADIFQPLASKAGAFTVAADIGTQEPGVPIGMAVILGVDTTNHTLSVLYPDGTTIKKAALT